MTSVLTFSPTGTKLEEYIGIPQDYTIDDLKEITSPASSYDSYLPSYATEEKITEWIANRAFFFEVTKTFDRIYVYEIYETYR